MGLAPPRIKPLALFVRMADDDFSNNVRNTLAGICAVQEVPSLGELPAKLPAALVVIAFSHVRQLAPFVKNLTVFVPRIPHFIVFPDGANPELVDPDLSWISRQLVDTQTTFKTIPYAEFPVVLEREVPFMINRQRKQSVGDSFSLSDSVTLATNPSSPPPLSPDLSVVFDDSLSAEQVELTLTALANYYRACGGVGLSVEFENQQAVTEEVHA